MTIKFGTSGWRGLIARDFTFDNVRLATQGIADFLNSEIRNPKSEIFSRKRAVIMGHDTRFLGREFSRSEEHTSELQSLRHLVYSLLVVKKKMEYIIEFKVTG